MSQFKEFTFTQCISEQHFKTRPSEDECSHIVFRPQEVTISRLLDYACHGGVFSPTCRSNKPDGLFRIKQKTRDNFVSSSTIFFDFDGMNTPMYEFIDGLDYKPSFAYTSYSNGVDGKGFRFRLGYVFNHPIVGNKNYMEIYYAIQKANSFPIETSTEGGLDERTEEQCYFGTRTDADTYNGGYYYAASEFNDFRSEYIGPDTLTTTRIINANTNIDVDFLKDFNTLTPKEFNEKYRLVFNKTYAQSLSSPLILDESGMFFTYPDDYVAVLRKRRGRKVLKWVIGDNRKNKIFITAQIMLHNVPTLSIENLLYNLRRERDRYYVNTDNKISNRFLLDVAKRAMKVRCKLHPTKHGDFKVNNDYWVSLGATSFNQVNRNQAKMYIRHLLKVREVKPYIDPFASLSENVRILKEQGIKISRRTLERMVTQGDIKIIRSTKRSISSFPPDLSCCRNDVPIPETNPLVEGILYLIRTADGRITQKTIAEALEVSIKTVKRYFQELEGTFIRREGNNRSGRWVVL